MIIFVEIPLLNCNGKTKKTYALSYQCFSEVDVLSLQARILALNASYFLKNGGHFVISIKVS